MQVTLQKRQDFLSKFETGPISFAHFFHLCKYVSAPSRFHRFKPLELKGGSSSSGLEKYQAMTEIGLQNAGTSFQNFTLHLSHTRIFPALAHPLPPWSVVCNRLLELNTLAEPGSRVFKVYLSIWTFGFIQLLVDVHPCTSTNSEKYARFVQQ